MYYKTTATELNLRKAPKVATGNVLAVLPEGQTVQKLADAGNLWWKVKTGVGGTQLEGYVYSSYLKKVNAPVPEPVPASKTLPVVHLKEGDSSVKRSNTRWAFPLGEPDMPRRNPKANSADRVAAIGKIIQYLEVEKSARYRPKTGSTYCNIYAYDFCYLTGVYVPRVWWTSKAIVDLRAGKKVSALYGSTVNEMNANSLYTWLCDYGAEFGWRRTVDFDELQNAANQGKIGIICAIRKNLNESGHICAVVPETTTAKATRVAGKVGIPLQSQAGRSNKAYFSSKWWTAAYYRAFGFWIHD